MQAAMMSIDSMSVEEDFDNGRVHPDGRILFTQFSFPDGKTGMHFPLWSQQHSLGLLATSLIKTSQSHKNYKKISF